MRWRRQQQKQKHVRVDDEQARVDELFEDLDGHGGGATALGTKEMQIKVERQRAANLAAERDAQRKSVHERSPAWWPRDPKPIVRKRPPPDPNMQAAAAARLKEIRAKLEAGEGLTAQEEEDATAILELKMIWAEQAKAAEEERQAARARPSAASADTPASMAKIMKAEARGKRWRRSSRGAERVCRCRCRPRKLVDEPQQNGRPPREPRSAIALHARTVITRVHTDARPRNTLLIAAIWNPHSATATATLANTAAASAASQPEAAAAAALPEPTAAITTDAAAASLAVAAASALSVPATALSHPVTATSAASAAGLAAATTQQPSRRRTRRTGSSIRRAPRRAAAAASATSSAATMSSAARRTSSAPTTPYRRMRPCASTCSS